MRATTMLLVMTLAVLQAQPASDATSLAERLGEYLLEYEKQLSTLLAQERYEQTEIRPPFGRVSLQGGIGSVRKQTVESEIAFLRLPGNREWYGVRNVLRVDGKPVESTLPRLIEVMGTPSADQQALTREIVAASSKFNLGVFRTTNMPTVPLDLIHPRHRPRFAFEARGTSRVSGRTTRELAFRELETPSLVRDSDGGHLLASGSVWIEPGNGRLWRVVMRFEQAYHSVRNASSGTNQMRLDFAVHSALDMVVPKELRETIDAARGGRLEGRATYSDFRRFVTAARIIPQ